MRGALTRKLSDPAQAASPSETRYTVLRLKESWAQEYEIWRRRPLDSTRFVYVWADGIYLGAGLEKQNSCLLTLLAARADGTK